MNLICFFGDVRRTVIDMIFNKLFEDHDEVFDADDDYEELIDVVVHQAAFDAIDKYGQKYQTKILYLI